MLPILNMLNQIGSTEVVKAYGLPALIAELAEEGISQNQVLREAGLSTLSDDLTIHERTALFGAAQALSRRPQAALLAGVTNAVKLTHLHLLKIDPPEAT